MAGFLSVAGLSSVLRPALKLCNLNMRSHSKSREKRVTIKDIAKVAGVTHGTVSRALNDSPLVKVETAKRIKRIAKRMGYRPDRIAQSLKRRRTKTIGLIIPDILNPFFATITHGVEEKATELGYHVILVNTNRDLVREASEIKLLCERKVDGLVICPISYGSAKHLRRFKNESPFILLGSNMPGLVVDYVVSDDVQGAYLATTHLIDLGHRRIAHISDPSNTSPAESRTTGYKKALLERKIRVEENLVVPGGANIDSGYNAAGKLFEMPDPPTAIFAANDLTAIGVLALAKERSISVPEELAVVGYDDIEIAKYVEPPLTTVAQDKRRLGRLAVQLLCDKLNSQEETDIHQIVVQPTLVVRASSRTASKSVLNLSKVTVESPSS